MVTGCPKREIFARMEDYNLKSSFEVHRILERKKESSPKSDSLGGKNSEYSTGIGKSSPRKM